MEDLMNFIYVHNFTLCEDKVKIIRWSKSIERTIKKKLYKKTRPNMSMSSNAIQKPRKLKEIKVSCHLVSQVYKALYSAYKKIQKIQYKWPIIGQYTDYFINCRPVSILIGQWEACITSLFIFPCTVDILLKREI